LVQSHPTLTIETIKISITQEHPNLGLPVHLKIPSINIDASIEYVGLIPDGAMDAPKEPANVGWLSPGYISRREWKRCYCWAVWLGK
jgi:hypothetical protein